MKILLFTFMLFIAGTLNVAFAADDFGAPFSNETPAALSDTPYVAADDPWDIEPAAGDVEVNETDLDLPASDSMIMQLKALEEENANIIVDDLSP